jgi:hypothetical protein
MQVEAREGVIDLPGSQGVTSSTPSASIHSQQWFLSTHDRRLVLTDTPNAHVHVTQGADTHSSIQAGSVVDEE